MATITSTSTGASVTSATVASTTLSARLTASSSRAFLKSREKIR